MDGDGRERDKRRGERGDGEVRKQMIFIEKNAFNSYSFIRVGAKFNFS